MGLFECAVDDEFHMVFDCSAFRELRSDLEFAHLFADPSVSMRDFCSADDPAVGLFIAHCMDAREMFLRMSTLNMAFAPCCRHLDAWSRRPCFAIT